MTKAAYESLVLAVLHGSSHDSAVGRHAIYERLGCLVRDVSSVVLNARIDSALERLSAKHGQLKHIRGTDSFHIAHEESGRIQRGTEIFLEEGNSLKQDILAALYLVDSEIVDDDARRDDCVQAIKRLSKNCCSIMVSNLRRAISTWRIPETEKGTLEHLLTEMAFKTHLPNTEAAKVIHLVLAYAADSTQEHLLRLLDSYTVLALLKSTPDVQKALRKVFAGETIWLGTSVILPLMAECLSAGSTPMRDLVKACHLSDIKLRVTSRVIEGVDAHLNVCVAGARSTSTSSFRLPFLLSEYLLSGRSRDTLCRLARRVSRR